MVNQCSGELTPAMAHDSSSRAWATMATSRAYDELSTPHSEASSCSASICALVVIMHL